jgi:hypothetical protein
MMMLMFAVVSLFFTRGIIDPSSSQPQTALNLSREYSLAPFCGMPVPYSHHGYFKALNPADKLSNEKSTSHHLFKALIGESLGISRIVFRNILQTTQIRFHNQLFLVPFCGHAPPAIHI